jgi:DNA-binding transcriptional ArsR family regulator
MRRDVFQAIADPTRREIISILASQTITPTAMADHFDVSRQAISKHIKILTECGLIAIKQEGRERYCEARLDRLNEVYTWVEQYHKYWETQFKSLEKYLDKLQKDKKNAGKK